MNMLRLAFALLALQLTGSLLAQQEPGLIAHWRFAPDRQLGDDVKPVFGGPDATFTGAVKFIADPAPPRADGAT